MGRRVGGDAVLQQRAVAGALEGVAGPGHPAAPPVAQHLELGARRVGHLIAVGVDEHPIVVEVGVDEAGELVEEHVRRGGDHLREAVGVLSLGGEDRLGAEVGGLRLGHPAVAVGQLIDARGSERAPAQQLQGVLRAGLQHHRQARAPGQPEGRELVEPPARDQVQPRRQRGVHLGVAREDAGQERLAQVRLGLGGAGARERALELDPGLCAQGQIGPLAQRPQQPRLGADPQPLPGLLGQTAVLGGVGEDALEGVAVHIGPAEQAQAVAQGGGVAGLDEGPRVPAARPVVVQQRLERGGGDLLVAQAGVGLKLQITRPGARHRGRPLQGVVVDGLPAAAAAVVQFGEGVVLALAEGARRAGPGAPRGVPDAARHPRPRIAVPNDGDRGAVAGPLLAVAGHHVDHAEEGV